MEDELEGEPLDDGEALDDGADDEGADDDDELGGPMEEGDEKCA